MPHQSITLANTLAAVAVAALVACAPEALERSQDVLEPPRGLSDSDASRLKIASWNLQWLYRTDGGGVVARQEADYAKLAEYAEQLDADVIAVQEVDGVAALQRVFDPSVYDFQLSARGGVQRTGFAYRKSLDATPRPELMALDRGSLRSGVDLEIEAGDETVRLLAVHLKSGCFSGSLTRSATCRVLKDQIGPLEGWIDARAAEGGPFVVLGDFNRRFFSSGNDAFWAEIDDGSPAGADLSSPTEEVSSTCNGGKYPDFIDHIVTGAVATERIVPDSFEQLVYDAADVESFELSDHCPISIELDLGGDEEALDPNSCVGQCGGQAAGGCWCNDVCESYGDCCDDWAEVCS